MTVSSTMSSSGFCFAPAVTAPSNSNGCGCVRFVAFLTCTEPSLHDPQKCSTSRGPRLRRHHCQPDSILITEFLTFSSVAPFSKLLLSVNTRPPLPREHAHSVQKEPISDSGCSLPCLESFFPRMSRLMSSSRLCPMNHHLPKALWSLGPQLSRICVCSYSLLYQFKICLQAKAGVIRVDPTCSISEITLGTDYGSLLGSSCFLCVSSFLADNSRKPSSISRFFSQPSLWLDFQSESVTYLKHLY